MVAPKKFTLKYMDGHEEHYENYKYYRRLTGDEKITQDKNKLYKAGKVFVKKKDDYWVETNVNTNKGSEFTLEFKNGSTKDFVGYRHYARLSDENKITRSNGRLYYQGKVFEEVVKDYWVETNVITNNGSEFTLEFKNGSTKKFVGYQHYARQGVENKITRSNGRLYYQGKVFEEVVKDYWVETNVNTNKGSEFTLEFKDGSTKDFVSYNHYASLNDERKMTRAHGRLYYQGKVFEQVVKDYWCEIDKGTKIDENHQLGKQIRPEGGPAKFKLVFANGEVKEFENYKKCSERKDSEKIVLGNGKKSLTYHGYRFIRDTADRHTWNQDTTRFNKIYDTFYLSKDWYVWEFENMQLYFNRGDSEHMELTRVDRHIKHNGKSKKVRRCITYKGTRYYNIDNWKTWVAINSVKYKKEVLNHSNKIPITKFYKDGVWIFTPDKKTWDYQEFLDSNNIYVFSKKYAFWSGALWEKEGKVWYYRKEMLQGDKVKKFIIPLNEDEYYFKAEIKHLRKQGFKINYRYVVSKRRQPNKRNKEQQEEFMKKVKKMSRADRKKALNKKKKRQGKYRERRGI